MAERIEKRFIAAPLASFEIRAGEDGEERPKIRGHVAVFDAWSPVYGDFRERIAPGFFDVALEDGADVQALYNHDQNMVLGTTSSGTARLSVDKRGLVLENDPPDTSYARDLLVLLERRDVRGGSFSFQLPPSGGDTWEKADDGVWERTLVKASWIGDVGPVSRPFYPSTELAVRSRDAWSAEHEGEDVAEEIERPRLAAMRRERWRRERLARLRGGGSTRLLP